MIVMPAIDLQKGCCVRLRQGELTDATIFSEDPVAMAAHWVQLGAKRLHIVDLDGAEQGHPAHLRYIEKVIQQHPELIVQVGGGIRTIEAVTRYIDIGVHYVIIGTLVVEQPELAYEMATKFPQRIIVGLDAKNGMLATQGWKKLTTISAIKCAQSLQEKGVAAIIYTDIARDGMLQGVNIEATKVLAESVEIPVIASGGLSRFDEIVALGEITNSGIIGVIAGRAIYEGQLDFHQAQTYCDSLSLCQ